MAVPQTDVFVDLVEARARDGGDVRFAVTDTAVDAVVDRPLLRFTDRDGRRHAVECDYRLHRPGLCSSGMTMEETAAWLKT